MFTYFTVASANKILPEVIEKFKHVVQLKQKIMKTEQELSIVLNSSSTFEQYINIKQALNLQMTEFYQAIAELEKTGVVIKGIDEGLLDFPSKRFDDEVWLCWKFGETEIKFWHEKDVGFNGRKPISVSDESLI